jgi:glutaminyl-tRNA synthetase
VSVPHAHEAEVRLYDALFTQRNPNDVPEGNDFTVHLNPLSLEVLSLSKVEPSLKDAPCGSRYQFERLGYFCVDPDTSGKKAVFNRIVTLRDTWAKIERKL